MDITPLMDDALAFNFADRIASKGAYGSLPMNWKRLGSGHLCLACGKLLSAPMCCKSCGLAFFCGPQCETAAAAQHKGALGFSGRSTSSGLSS